ncbi:unnamed protein product [Linum trigynum]|uniref:RNase H type-1 domain-containing protein n=1 Tax=Linum trigynum TaxID=586398 RepID=A0AAV2DP36_9ROSI
MAYPRHAAHNDSLWRKIWRLHVPERVCCFTWLVALGKIATNVLRFTRKCADSPDCHRCAGTPETILHTLRDCPPAAFFWYRQVPQAEHHKFFSASVEDWISSNVNQDEEMESGMAWNDFFASAIWLLWKNRCTACFKGIGAALTAPTLANSIHYKAALWHMAWKSDNATRLQGSHAVPRVLANISWVAPHRGWMKLNVDGASAGNPGQAGAGGLIRDEHGRWQAGFVAMIGEATAALAELWALFHGLNLAWKFRCTNLLIETDSQLVIQWLKSRSDPLHPYASLLASIRRRMAQDWLVNITHTYREGNRAADWLSKHSLVYPYGVHEFVNPPTGIGSILQEDMRGLSFERRVIATRDL